MTERLADFALFVTDRALLLVIAFLALAAVKLGTQAAAPAAHPERVVVTIR